MSKCTIALYISHTQPQKAFTPCLLSLLCDGSTQREDKRGQPRNLQTSGIEATLSDPLLLEVQLSS